jgi:hypothetical protein
MACEQVAVHDGVTLHHDVVDGLSTYWVADSGPFHAVLAFRVGAADETLPTRGVCHLVEHLAIEPQPRLYAHNGWCTIDSTGFWAEGDRDEVLEAPCKGRTSRASLRQSGVLWLPSSASYLATLRAHSASFVCGHVHLDSPAASIIERDSHLGTFAVLNRLSA